MRKQIKVVSSLVVVLGSFVSTPSLSQTPSAPSVRIYGFAELHAIYDVKQSSSPDLFTDLAFQPLNDLKGPRGKTQLTAETSRFGFEATSSTASGPLIAKLEADFYSYSSDNRNRVRLRHAYGEYKNWLIGKTWSTFMDLDNLPETVDFNGAVGAPFSRRTMVRFSFGDAKENFKVTLAAEDPEDQFGGGSSNERMPQIIGRIDKQFGSWSVNGRALVHEKRSVNSTKRGKGIAIGGNYKLSSKDTFMAQYTRVDGDIDHLYGSNGYSIDATTGVISFDKNSGLVLGYARVFNDQLRGNIVYGANRGKSGQAAVNKSLDELFVNLVYSPVKNVELGGELIYGKRKTFEGTIGTLKRLDLMARYSF
jgi:DcaP outer membrane protein